VRCFAFWRRFLHVACGRFVAPNCISISYFRIGKKRRRALPRLDRPQKSILHASANQRRRVHKCDMAQQGAMSMQALLTVDQLAAWLRKSIASIRSDATRNPQSLPPVCRLPGTKRLLWRVEDVESWLGAHVAKSVLISEPGELPASPRRGRPTKAEQVARQRRESHSLTRADNQSTDRAVR